MGGLVLVALFFAAFLGPLFRARRLEGWQAGVSVGLAVFALHNLADFTAFLQSTLWLAALLRGYLAVGEAGRPRPAAGWLRALALAAVLLATVAVALSGLAQETRFRAVGAVADRESAPAVRLADRATRLAPWNVDGWLLKTQVQLDRLPAHPEALAVASASIERAVRRSPVRPVARALRARVRAMGGDFPGAYADLVEASRLYPVREEYASGRDAVLERLLSRGAAP